MRNGSNILNHADFQTGALQSADGSLTAGARAFNQTFNLLQTMHHGLLGGHIGSLLGGTAIIESIFMWDGVGKLAVDAITMRDYPLIQAYVVWMAIIYMLVNLVTDLLYHALDPRIRLGVSAQ